jgi:hypothetical protein
MRNERPAKPHGGIVPRPGKSSEGYCVALGFTVWCIHSKHRECFCRRAHKWCASEKRKPVVRWGRKAKGLLARRWPGC